jgi:HEAT repeat protein
MREKAIFWLGQSGSADNAAWLRSLYGRLRDEELKEKVIFSLSQMGSRENGRWLVEVAKNPNEPVEMRKKALFWAGQTGSLTGADLGALYDTMRDREMKEQIIFSLSQMSNPQAMDKLIAIARRDPDPELRKKALFWVGQSNDPRAAEMLEAVLEGR